MRRPKTKVRGVIDKEETGARGLFKVISDAGIVGWISDNEDGSKALGGSPKHRRAPDVNVLSSLVEIASCIGCRCSACKRVEVSNDHIDGLDVVLLHVHPQRCALAQ